MQSTGLLYPQEKFSPGQNSVPAGPHVIEPAILHSGSTPHWMVSAVEILVSAKNETKTKLPIKKTNKNLFILLILLLDSLDIDIG